MNQIQDIAVRLREFYTPSEIDTWLTVKHPQLNDESPLSALANGRGDKVIAILDRLESDVFL